MVLLGKGEKIVLQEGCREDSYKDGWLTLTNQRLIFESAAGIFANKRTTVFSFPINTIHNVCREGISGRKLVIELSAPAGPEMPKEIRKYSFGFIKDMSNWEKAIKDAVAKL